MTNDPNNPMDRMAISVEGETSFELMKKRTQTIITPINLDHAISALNPCRERILKVSPDRNSPKFKLLLWVLLLVLILFTSAPFYLAGMDFYWNYIVKFNKRRTFGPLRYERLRLLILRWNYNFQYIKIAQFIYRYETIFDYLLNSTNGRDTSLNLKIHVV